MEDSYNHRHETLRIPGFGEVQDESEVSSPFLTLLDHRLQTQERYLQVMP